GAANPDDNVRVTAAEAVAGGGKTINALLLGSTGNTGTASYTVTGGTISVASGAILNTTVGSIVSAPVDFGTKEGVILAYSTGAASVPAANNGVSFTGGISGSGGLTRLGMGNYYPGASNTYTGETYIEGGRTVLVADVLPGVPSPFGNSTTPVHFVGSIRG